MPGASVSLTEWRWNKTQRDCQPGPRLRKGMRGGFDSLRGSPSRWLRQQQMAEFVRNNQFLKLGAVGRFTCGDPLQPSFIQHNA